MKSKTYLDMTRKEFEAVPHRKWGEDIGLFATLVILPTRRMHDSGYRCIEFVAVRDGKPLKRLGGGSDVVHVGGLAQPLLEWVKVGWSIDCLPKSGLLQLFCPGHYIRVGMDLSSFEVYSAGPFEGATQSSDTITVSKELPKSKKKSRRKV